jgi:hypothetical protein
VSAVRGRPQTPHISPSQVDSVLRVVMDEVNILCHQVRVPLLLGVSASTSAQPHVVTLIVTLMHFHSATLSERKHQVITQSEPHPTWKTLHTPQQSTQQQTLNTLPIELQERIVIMVRLFKFRFLTPPLEHLLNSSCKTFVRDLIR